MDTDRGNIYVEYIYKFQCPILNSFEEGLVTLNFMLATLFGNALLGVPNKGTSTKNSKLRVILEQIKF